MTDLFRREVVLARSETLSGEVALAVPVSWQAIGYLIATGMIAAIAFLSFADYARVQTVSGTIVPDAGVAAIVPTRAGVISELPVREGQRVEAAAPLVMIRAEEAAAEGLSAAARMEAAIARQDASLASQADAARAATQAQLSQLSAQKLGLSAEIEQLRLQMSLQKGLVGSAERDVERGRALAAQGYMSKRDLQLREETLLTRQQALAQLQQSLESRAALLAEADRSTGQITSLAKAQDASLAASRAEVAQLAANTSGSRAYVLRAPVAGRVTALIARVGQPAAPQAPLMNIVPEDSVLRAELAAPSTAIGFIKPGQDVRLAIDAFPYQRFGVLKGRILTVAASPVSSATAAGAVVSVYPVRVALDRATMDAFGRREPLTAGMTLTARIVTEKQSLLEWLFEPLFAVGRR